MSDKEIQEVYERAERNYEMLKDKVHEQFLETIKLKARIDKAIEYIEENCGADNRLALKGILKGE